ncbi:MAG: protein-glutamate O-methyltransferase CheR [Thermodesulfobacteriota bacterium]
MPAHPPFGPLPPPETPSPEPQLMMRISEAEFQALRTLISHHFGIHLTDEKKNLVVGRLQKHLRQQGFTSFREYHDHLIGRLDRSELDSLVNAISTNYSYFYREEKHFQYLLNVALPALTGNPGERRNRELRIWSAGCSTGEEPYLLVMLLMEFFKLEYSLWDAGVLATDISSRVLQIAREAVYEQERIYKLPLPYRQQYFTGLADGRVKVKDTVRREVTFRRFNLMNHDFPFRKPFHIIFCRNVMIYFDQPTREALLERFYRFLLPGGYLFIGHSETLGRERAGFRFLIPACYQRL